jgi:hypothetical protein
MLGPAGEATFRPPGSHGEGAEVILEQLERFAAQVMPAFKSK